MFNSIHIFGMALLGGLGAGEGSRRALALLRTTGYVVFGLLVGQSGLGWIQPTASIALVLLVNMQTLYTGLEPRLIRALLATSLLMQVFGPWATQTAIKGFGEATCLQSDDSAAAKPASNRGSWGAKS